MRTSALNARSASALALALALYSGENSEKFSRGPAKKSQESGCLEEFSVNRRVDEPDRGQLVVAQLDRSPAWRRSFCGRRRQDVA